MLGEPKGYVFINKEIKYSRKPPQVLYNDFDMAEDYFNALQMKLVSVIDVAVSGDSYLVFGKGEKSGPFIWDIDKRDTTGEMIPYKLLHPEPDLEDLIKLMSRLAKGELTDEDTEMIFSFMAMWKGANHGNRG